MTEAQLTFEEAWAVAASLPPPARQILAKKLLQERTDPGEQSVVVVLQRFAPSVQIRLDDLLAKSNEGALTAEERADLTALVTDYERMMLANTEALLRASQPELFDSTGRLVRSRLALAARRHRERSISS